MNFSVGRIHDSNRSFDVVQFKLSETTRPTLVGKRAFLKLWISRSDVNETDVSVQVHTISSDSETPSKLGQRTTAAVNLTDFRDTWLPIDVGMMVSNWFSVSFDANFRTFRIAVRVVDGKNNEIDNVIEIRQNSRHLSYLEILED